jgi:putative copper export protein
VLSPSGATIRLFIHVVAATVWVGGQLVLAGLVRPLRALSPDAPRIAARHFNRIAWPAFFVLVASGIWNLVAIHVVDTSPAYQVTLMLKIAIVAASGMGAFVHTQANGNKAALAIGGALAGVGALVALFLGVLLHAHH